MKTAVDKRESSPPPPWALDDRELLNGDGTYPRMWGIDDKWFGDGHTNGAWRDTNVRFEGPAVRQLEAAFAAAWAEATGVLFTGRLTAESHEGGLTAGLLYTTPTLGSTAAERFLALSIAGARKTLYITNPYFVPDANFIELLAATARRGVDVRSSQAVRRRTPTSCAWPTRHVRCAARCRRARV